MNIYICMHLTHMEISSGTTPLHDAASQGDFSLVKEIYEKTPQLAQATDSRRRLPIHLASAGGYADIVRLLMSNDDQLDIYTARDVDGRNPLHLAAIHGRVEVLTKLVEKCPHAAEARADRGETILHLCFKYNHKEEFKLLLDNAKLEELVNDKDDNGNTLLHLAVAADQNTPDLNLEVVERLLDCNSIDVNAMNSKGKTALDVAVELERKSRQKLESSTVGRAKDFAKLQVVKTLVKQGAKRGEELVGNMEWLTSKRDALMVVASLMATIAFQAAVSPPGGVWQDSADGHRAGEAVMAYNSPDTYPYYLRLNTISFVGSLSIILMLLVGESPIIKKGLMWLLVLLMWLTVVTMTISYLLAITVVTPKKDAGSLPRVRLVILVWSVMMFVYTALNILLFVKNVIKERKLEIGKRIRSLFRFC